MDSLAKLTYIHYALLLQDYIVALTSKFQGSYAIGSDYKWLIIMSYVHSYRTTIYC
jgi:hypothetical protein